MGFYHLRLFSLLAGVSDSQISFTGENFIGIVKSRTTAHHICWHVLLPINILHGPEKGVPLTANKHSFTSSQNFNQKKIHPFRSGLKVGELLFR